MFSDKKQSTGASWRQRVPESENKLIRIAGNHPDKEHIVASLTKAITSRNIDPVSLVSQLPGSISYVNGQSLWRHATHWGQRKLFDAEVEFLTIASRGIDKSARNYVIYIGAAPNNKGWELVNLFTHFTFIFVDPAQFCLYYEDGSNTTNNEQDGIVFLDKKCDQKYGTRSDIDHDVKLGDYASAIQHPRNAKTRLFLIENFMTMSLAFDLARLPNLFFMSDMRTNNSTDTKYPLNADICNDNAFVYVITNILRPLLSSLKYREVFAFDSKEMDIVLANTDARVTFEIASFLGADFLGAYRNRKHMSQVGDIHLQVWAPVSSCEARLWVRQSDLLGKVVLDKGHEDAFNFFNVVFRQFYHFSNPYANRDLAFGHCYDCAYECKVFTEYYQNVYENKNALTEAEFVHSMIRNIERTTGRSTRFQHTCYFSHLPSSRTNRIGNTRPSCGM